MPVEVSQLACVYDSLRNPNVTPPEAPSAGRGDDNRIAEKAAQLQ